MTDYQNLVVSLSCGRVGGKYWAISTWDSGQEHWQVRIEDHDEHHRGDTTAERLTDAGRNARIVLAAEFGVHPDQVEISVEARLPTPLVDELKAAEALVGQAAGHVDTAVAALREASLSAHDIAAIVEARALQAQPQEPLLLPNDEIANYGLAHWRPAIVYAVQRDLGDRTLTVCGACVDKDPRSWHNNPSASPPRSTTPPPAATSAATTSAPSNADRTTGDPDRPRPPRGTDDASRHLRERRRRPAPRGV